MRIFRRVPTLRFDLVGVHGALVAIEIRTAFEMTNVLGIVLVTGLGRLVEVVGGAEGGVLGTAVVIVGALEASSRGRSVDLRLLRINIKKCAVKVLPGFAFQLERFVLLPAVAHGGARRELCTFVFRNARGQYDSHRYKQHGLTGIAFVVDLRAAGGRPNGSLPGRVISSSTPLGNLGWFASVRVFSRWDVFVIGGSGRVKFASMTPLNVVEVERVTICIRIHVLVIDSSTAMLWSTMAVHWVSVERGVPVSFWHDG